MGGYYGPPQSSGEPPEYPQYPAQPGYPPPAYPAPGYPPPGYPPAYWPPPYGYSPGPAPTRFSVPWTGVALAVGALMAIVGSFLTWVHLTIGAETIDYAGTGGGRDGKITVVFGALLLAGAVLIIIGLGRIWVGITATVLSGILVLVALADIGDVSNRNDRLAGLGHVEAGFGLVLVLLGALVALAFAIVATCVRRAK
jgi:hypothetical protein